MNLAPTTGRGSQGSNDRSKLCLAIVLMAATVIAVSSPVWSGSTGGAASSAMGQSPAAYLARLGKGKFLVADRKLNDPNFRETVVLLLQYSPRGAMGLVVNRPTDVRLSHAVPEIEELERRDDTLHKGGPVPSEALFLLFRSARPLAESNRVFGDVFLSPSLGVLDQLVNGAGGESDFRLYVGHSGWGPGQLEYEIEGGHWHVVDGVSDLVFAEKPSSVWQRLIPRSPTQVAVATDRESSTLRHPPRLRTTLSSPSR